MSSLARADALAVIPEGLARVEPGESVQIQMLAWPGMAAGPG